MGTSRACGDNHIKSSIHAEQICINYCRNYDKKINMKYIFGDIQRQVK